MNKNIFIASFEVPGFGGASTSAYKFFEMMQKDGLDVTFLNMIAEEDVDYLNYVYGDDYGNPKGLKNVINYILKGSWHEPQAELCDIIEDVMPDIVIGLTYIPAYAVKKASPESRLIFFTAACTQSMEYIASKKAKDLQDLRRILESSKSCPVIMHRREADIVRLAELVVTHNDTVKYSFERFFPWDKGKIYPESISFAGWICEEAREYISLSRPFEERDIDLLFAASLWSRNEKNYKYVVEMAKELKRLNIHIAGEVPFKIDGVVHEGLVAKRSELFALLGRAKTVVCPSIYDSAPGILFEASIMGCNIVASKNCGNWNICNPELLVEPFTPDGFTAKARASLLKKYADNLDYFLAPDPYRKAVDIIKTF